MKIIYKPETKTFIIHEVTIQEFRVIKNSVQIAISQEEFQMLTKDREKAIQLNAQLQDVAIGYI